MIQINVICNSCRTVGGTSYAYNSGVHVLRREMQGKGWLRLPTGEDYCPGCRHDKPRKLSAPQQEILSEVLNICGAHARDDGTAQAIAEDVRKLAKP